jgi:hypothetical protein
MSNSYLTRRLHCGNDCRQAGCPGHDVTLHHAHTSSTVAVLMDGQHYVTFDAAIWRALVNMEEESRERS